MNTKWKNKIVALFSTTALISALFIATPVAANAAPLCDGKSPIQSCVGLTSDGAPYSMMVPANFNGTVALYSHGYRFNVDIPVGFPPPLGGYKVTNTPEPVPNGNMTVAGYLFSQGVAIMGSGFARQGWNTDSAIATNVELISVFKKAFPTTTKVIAWGQSMGGFITQGLAEKHPALISAAAPICIADNIEPQLTMAGDFLWGLKVLFDPSIKGGNYSAGAAGVAESYGDLVKVFTVIGKLQASFGTGGVAWPDTSSAVGKGLATAGIPMRSALLLLGLMTGIPTQSTHFDSITVGPLGLGFTLAVSPALAILQNGAFAAALAVLATQDVESQAGGAIFDNTATNYGARIVHERVVFNAALSGNNAINGMLQMLSPPFTTRAKADPAAVAKMRALHTNAGKINVPTVLMVGIADPTTPAGATQRIVDVYTLQAAAEKVVALKASKATGGYTRPSNKLLTLWDMTPASYTTFTAAGAPITTTPPAKGAGHCNLTTAQLLFVAKTLISASATGKLPSGGALTFAVRKVGLSIDPFFRAPLLKYYNE